MLPDSASASLPWSANWLSKLFLHPQALCLWSQVLPILLACQGSHWHHLFQAVGMQLCSVGSTYSFGLSGGSLLALVPIQNLSIESSTSGR